MPESNSRERFEDYLDVILMSFGLSKPAMEDMKSTLLFLFDQHAEEQRQMCAKKIRQDSDSPVLSTQHAVELCLSATGEKQ